MMIKRILLKPLALLTAVSLIPVQGYGMIDFEPVEEKERNPYGVKLFARERSKQDQEKLNKQFADYLKKCEADLEKGTIDRGIGLKYLRVWSLLPSLNQSKDKKQRRTYKAVEAILDATLESVLYENRENNNKNGILYDLARLSIYRARVFHQQGAYDQEDQEKKIAEEYLKEIVNTSETTLERFKAKLLATRYGLVYENKPAVVQSLASEEVKNRVKEYLVTSGHLKRNPHELIYIGLLLEAYHKGEKAIDWYLAAGKELQYVKGYTYAGNLSRKQGNLQKAIEYWQQAVDEREAEHNLGDYYYSFLHTPEGASQGSIASLNQAFYWWLKAGSHADNEAWYKVAKVYKLWQEQPDNLVANLQGLTVERLQEEAENNPGLVEKEIYQQLDTLSKDDNWKISKKEELVRAIFQERINAYYRLGKLYEQGQEIKQDYEEAVQWYKKAARLEIPEEEKAQREQQVKAAIRLFGLWAKDTEKKSLANNDDIDGMYSFYLSFLLNNESGVNLYRAGRLTNRYAVLLEKQGSISGANAYKEEAQRYFREALLQGYTKTSTESSEVSKGEPELVRKPLQ